MLQTETDVIATVPRLQVTWDPENLTVSVWNGRWSAIARPIFSIRGEDARRFAGAIVVTYMRGGTEAVSALLREVFDQRGSAIAPHMYFAERNSYRKCGRFFVRDMEA